MMKRGMERSDRGGSVSLRAVGNDLTEGRREALI